MYKAFLTPEKICSYLVVAFEQKKGIFIKRINAEDFTPRGSDADKAQFLFWVIQMDYAMKSERLYKNAVDAWKSNRELFNPKYILYRKEKDLKDLIIKFFSPRYPSEIAKRFLMNAEKLLTEYEGKAISIVRQADSAKKLLASIRSFRGFGPKLGNFLLRTYIALFNPGYDDVEEIYQPVDRHDVRLTYEWGFIDSPKMTKANILKVKKLWQDACKEANVSWVTFDRALWVLGSSGVRTKSPKEDFYKNLSL